MKKLLGLLASLGLALGVQLACVAPAHAEVFQATYGVAKVFPFKLYNADGTLDVDEADGGTEVSLSCNQGAETTATNDFVDEGTHYSISLTAAEMQCQTIVVVIAATTTEVFFIQTSGHASAFQPTYEVNVATHSAGAIEAADFAAGAIDAAAIATDAIGAAEIAASAIGSSELADGGITSAEFGSGAITATVLAADSITASEIADNAIDAGALATDTITAAKIAADAIAASEIAADAIGASEIATDAIGSAELAAGAIAAAEIANAAIDEATYASDTNPRFGILTTGTAQAGSTGTTLVLAAAENFTADNRITGATCAITSGTGAGESLAVASYVNATDTATMNGTWPTTPDNTSVYLCWRTAPGSSGSGLDAAGVRAAIGMSSANLDTQLSGIESGISWNSAWDAEVQSEANDALVANYLDQLLLNTYNPASPPGASDSLLEDLIENDAGVTRFNSNALEQAPTAGGGNMTQIEGVDATDAIDARIAAAALATATNLATVDTVVDAIKAKTDNLTFTVSGQVDANTESMNAELVCGTGDSGNAWKGCP